MCTFANSKQAAVRQTCILLLLSSSVCVAAIEEVEPNDTLETSTQTELAAVGRVTVADAFLGNGPAGPRDVDLFGFEISADAPPLRLTVDVHMPRSSLDAFVRLFDATGLELVVADDRSFDDTNPHLVTELAKPGVYYVGVSAARNPHYDPVSVGSGMPASTGAYTLDIELTPAYMPTSSLEPNDTIESATPVGSESFARRGEYIGDGANGRSDVDVYRLTLTGPARIDARVQAAAVDSPLDPVLIINEIVSDDCQDGGTDPALSMGIPYAQDLNIVVSGAGNAQFRPVYDEDLQDPGSVGRYDLIVDVTYFDGSGTNEPNDSLSLATDLQLDTHRLSHGIIGDGPYHATRGDRDFYRVTASRTGILTVEVAPTSGSELNPLVAVYNSIGQRIGMGRMASDGTTNTLDIPLECIVSDPYASLRRDHYELYVMVSGAGDRLPNDPAVPWDDSWLGPDWRYEAFVIDDGPGSTGAYELRTQIRETPCGSEPNDSLATAVATGLVDQGVYVCTDAILGNGPCEPASPDIDFWSVEVMQAPAVLDVVMIACDGRPEADSVTLFFDESGNEIPYQPVAITGRRRSASVVIEQAGRYYVAITDNVNWSLSWDPAIPCTSDEDSSGEQIPYNVVIRLSQPPSRPLVDPSEVRSAAPAQLFSTRLGDGNNTIDVRDAAGELVNSFPAPEPGFGGAEGLAFENGNLFYLGIGRYPNLYRLDPATGQVLSKTALWQGSGYYADMTMLGGRLYLVDLHDHAVHLFDPIASRALATLNVGAINGISIGGGLAALTGPSRLYLSDAFSTQRIFEVDPVSGQVTGEIAPQADRPTALSAAGGDGHLYVGDWQTPEIEVLHRSGRHIDDWSLPNPVGALGGQPFAGLFADCDDDGVPDVQSIAAGTSYDCNDNGIPDACDVADATSYDCNASGVPDVCELDCKGNGSPDDCDLSDVFAVVSPRLSPIGADWQQSFMVLAPPEPVGDVVLNATAFGDFSNTSEFIDVSINGTLVGTLFESTGNDCGAQPSADQLNVSADTFSQLTGGADATIHLSATPAVDAFACGPQSYVRVGIEYNRDPASEDCNENGIPDDCETDCNDSGTPDDCDIADGGSADEDGNGVPDECEGVLFVDAQAMGVGDGTSWASAFTDLQDGLTEAAVREGGIREIRMAAGIYTPAPAGGDRDASFQLVRGVVLSGGYAGGAGHAGERDPRRYPTILSGDLNGDDDPEAGTGHEENSYHVVKAIGTGLDTVLDGLAIRDGYADGLSWDRRAGAGLFNLDGDLTIRQCSVARNHVGGEEYRLPRRGAGLYSRGGNLAITDCVFQYNGHPRLDRRLSGGGIYLEEGYLTLTGCTIADNYGGNGAGLFLQSGRAFVTDCRFLDNVGPNGGGIMAVLSDLHVRDCLFARNGAMLGQTLFAIGGRIVVDRSTSQCRPFEGFALSFRNSGRVPGGSDPCGGGVCNDAPSDVLITNSILWDPVEEIENLNGSTVTIRHSDVRGGWSGPGGGNIAVDPMFVDPEAGNYRLAPGSPAINAADPAFAPSVNATDLDGHARVLCGRLDMGAFEFGIGDVDCDQSVDLNDLRFWAACMKGPNDEPLPASCVSFDFNADDHVDLADFAGYQQVFEGP